MKKEREKAVKKLERTVKYYNNKANTLENSEFYAKLKVAMASIESLTEYLAHVRKVDSTPVISVIETIIETAETLKNL